MTPRRHYWLLASLAVHGVVAAAAMGWVVSQAVEAPRKIVVRLERDEERPVPPAEPVEAPATEPRLRAEPATPREATPPVVEPFVPFEPPARPAVTEAAVTEAAVEEPETTAAKTWLEKLRQAPPRVEVVRPAVEPTPITADNEPPRYPRLAVRQQISGTTVIEVEVDARGSVVSCRVATSSGHRLLDRAALAAVRGWRFRDGPGTTRVPIEFRLVDR